MNNNPPKQHANFRALFAQRSPLPLLHRGCYLATVTRTLPLPGVLPPLRRTGADAAAAPVPDAILIVLFPLDDGPCQWRGMYVPGRLQHI
jgi:hypothetical protein